MPIPLISNWIARRRQSQAKIESGEKVLNNFFVAVETHFNENMNPAVVNNPRFKEALGKFRADGRISKKQHKEAVEQLDGLRRKYFGSEI